MVLWQSARLHLSFLLNLSLTLCALQVRFWNPMGPQVWRRCVRSLALMDAGVPLKSPVAGISIGICTETDGDDQIDRYQILTDIIGWEDAFCDMDCKIAGSASGITGFQLDLKLKGLPLGIMEEAIQKAKEAREAVLEKMAATLAEPRKEFSNALPNHHGSNQPG